MSQSGGKQNKVQVLQTIKNSNSSGGTPAASTNSSNNNKSKKAPNNVNNVAASTILNDDIDANNDDYEYVKSDLVKRLEDDLKKLRIEIAGALLTVSPQDAAAWFAHVATVFSNVR